MSGYLLAQKAPLFDGVEPHVVSALLRTARRRSADRGDPIADSGFGALIVFAGSVKVFHSAADGSQVMLRLLRAGDVMASCPGSTLLEQAEALEGSDVMLIGRDELFAAIEHSHPLACNLLRLAAARLDSDEALIHAFAFSTVEQRLAALLSELAQRYGRPIGAGTRIELPLSQDALAGMLGAGRRSITRAITRWARSGAIRKSDGRFVLDAKRLEPRLSRTST